VTGDIITLVLLPLALGCIMVTLGFGLTVTDFRRVLVAPKGVVIGLANLVLLAPALAFAIAELFDLEPAFAVGLVLLGASPGGTLANLLTHLARGETALSITMTAVSSVLAVVTVPVYLTLAIDHFGATGLDNDPEMLGIVVRVFAITVIPLAIGMTVRERSPAWVAEHEARAKQIAFAAFVLVVAGAVASEFRETVEHLGELAAAAIALNLAAMTLSFAIARGARLSDPAATAIALELGVHNAALAIAVGSSVDTILTIPAAVYSSFMFLSAGVFARVMYQRNGPAVMPS
jgi:BASS family bile acid:Na+ symporter